MHMINNIDAHVVMLLFVLVCNLLTLFRIRFVMISAGLYRVMKKHVHKQNGMPNTYIALMIFAMLSIMLCLFAPVVYYQIYTSINSIPYFLFNGDNTGSMILFGGCVMSLINYVAIEVVGVQLYCKIISLQFNYQKNILDSFS